MKMEPTVSSETSEIQTPGNYPKRNTLHLENGESLKTKSYNLFTCKGINSLPPTRLLVPLHVNKMYHTSTYNRLPEDEASSSNHVAGIVQLQILECSHPVNLHVIQSTQQSY